jgi:hypothetical protein
VLDLSGGRTVFAEQLVHAGRDVVHVRPTSGGPTPTAAGPGRLLPVVADARALSWVADGSVDAVLAEARALSLCLATEVVAEELRRVLRPGGQLLLVVESLLLGLSRLAEAGGGPSWPTSRAPTSCWSRPATGASAAASGPRSSRGCCAAPASRSTGCGRGRCCHRPPWSGR